MPAAILDEVAADVAAATARADNPDDPNPATRFGPAEILMIISLITALVKLYKACKKTPAEAHRSMQHPTVWERFRLRWTIWRNGGSLPKAAAYSALLDWGYASTFGQVSRLYAAIPDDYPPGPQGDLV